MTSLKLATFERQLSIAVSPILDPRERALAIAAFAAAERDKVLAEQRIRSGMAPTVAQTVDGNKGAALESIRPGGRIRFDFGYLREIAAWTLEWLRQASPLGGPKKGNRHYRDAHFVLAGGSAVDPEAIPPETLQIIVTNDVPYARKLQIRGGRIINLPPGIYDRARKAVQGRYGNAVEAQLRFIGLEGAYVLQTSGGSRRKDRQAGRALTYPALVITAR